MPNLTMCVYKSWLCRQTNSCKDSLQAHVVLHTISHSAKLYLQLATLTSQQ